MAEYIAHPTNENLRIHVDLDAGPPKPYHDGGFPLWRIERLGYAGAAAVQEADITSYLAPHELDHAIGRMFDAAWSYSQIERYLRIFWGATFAQWWHSGSYQYVMADPAHWREHVEVTDEITRREDYTKHAWTEWRAWVEGDVWFATEQVRLWQRTTVRTWDPTRAEDPEDPESSDEVDEHTTDGYVWDDRDSVGGFYGDVDQDMAQNVAWQFGWDVPDGHTFEIHQEY